MGAILLGSTPEDIRLVRNDEELRRYLSDNRMTSALQVVPDTTEDRSLILGETPERLSLGLEVALSDARPITTFIVGRLTTEEVLQAQDDPEYREMRRDVLTFRAGILDMVSRTQQAMATIAGSKV